MAITKEQAEAWAGPGTSADEFPIPQGRFNKGRLTELLKVLLSIVECFKPSSASYLFEHNLLPVIQDDVEKFLGRQKELIKKLETKQTPKHLVLSEADEESSRRGLGAAWPPVRVSNPLYGFWHVRWLSHGHVRGLTLFNCCLHCSS